MVDTTQPIIVSLAACLPLLLVFLQFSYNPAVEATSLIEGPKVASYSDGATKLRPYLSREEDSDTRCKRYGLMLKKVYKKQFEYFKLVELALTKKDRLAVELRTITYDELKNLYISGIEDFLAKKYVNSAAVELRDCLKGFEKKYHEAAKFLNNPELQKIMSQYQAITSQPARLLVEGKHPHLKLEELHETVANSVARWFENGTADLHKMFKSVHEPDNNVVAHAEASHHQEVAPVQSRDNQQSSPVVEMAAAASSVVESGEDQQPDDKSADDAYLADLYGATIFTFGELPPDVPQSQRCRAYAKIIETSLTDEDTFYKDGFLSSVVAEASKPSSDPEKPFVPEHKEFIDFFVSLVEKFDPIQGNPDAWADLVDCVQEWYEINEEAKKFLEGEVLHKRLEVLEAMHVQGQNQANGQ